MPWYAKLGFGRRSLPVEPAAQPEAVTAAASPVKAPQSQFLQHVQTWQAEVWNYHDTIGEFRYGVKWRAAMLSRVRLRAAKIEPGQDEPKLVDEGLASEFISELGGDAAGRAQLMSRISVQLDVPGEGYLIGEDDVWTVRSVDEVRAQNGKYQVVRERIPNITWGDLSANSLVVRVWNPHDRYYHTADSAARPAAKIMQELDLVNRDIIAKYLSRIASAGLLVVPSEVEFPTRPEFADAPDPLYAEFLEIAATAIREPGTAAAVVPMMMKVPAEYKDAFQHIDFTLKIDEKIIEKRESAIKRLATSVNIPAEIMLGMGDVNHWGQWQLEESGLKTHIAPPTELICQAITQQYLQPRLKASGEKDWAHWVCWYDMSELAMRPDKSQNASEAYDRLELSGKAYRRELGFDEADKPKDDELKEQGLKVIIKTLPSGASAALSQLIGEDLNPIVPVSPQAPDVAEETQKGNTPESPDTGEKAPVSRLPARPGRNGQGPPQGGESSPEEEQKQAAARRLHVQSQTLHVIKFSVTRPPQLVHPPLCADHAYSCPFTHALQQKTPTALSSGAYECRLDAFGLLAIGRSAPEVNTLDWIETQVMGRVATNGHVRT